MANNRSGKVYGLGGGQSMTVSAGRPSVVRVVGCGFMYKLSRADAAAELRARRAELADARAARVAGYPAYVERLARTQPWKLARAVCGPLSDSDVMMGVGL